MENSDSDDESFESADEDFQAEEMKSTKQLSEIKSCSQTEKLKEIGIKVITREAEDDEVKNRTIEDVNLQISNLTCSNTSNTTNVLKVDNENNARLKESNIRPNCPDLKPKLGQKLVINSTYNVSNINHCNEVLETQHDNKCQSPPENTIDKDSNFNTYNNEENLWNDDEEWVCHEVGDSTNENKLDIWSNAKHSKSDVLVDTRQPIQQLRPNNLWESWGNEVEDSTNKAKLDIWSNAKHPKSTELVNNTEKSEVLNLECETLQQPILQLPPDNLWESWGNWSVRSILSTATQGVSTITSQVSQGFTTALESGIGVVNPEELARINKSEEVKIEKMSQKSQQNVNSNENISKLGGFAIGDLVKLVESTGSKVITGGLDTLETIGKKTMEVLQEGDPGLKKKRAFLKIDHNKPVLSQLLREAKEKSESDNKSTHSIKKVKNYETLFDDHQGLVHLEALELLSKQCEIKLESVVDSQTSDKIKDTQKTLEQVKELCELPDDEDGELISISEIKHKLQSAIEEINLQVNYEKLISPWEEMDLWLDTMNFSLIDEKELHQQCIESLAQLTAVAVEQFHKIAELLMIKDHRSTADEADSLVQLTVTLTSLIGLVAAKFSEKLNTKGDQIKDQARINELITNIFFEAGNSSCYVQDAFQLLIPVLQVGAV